MPGAVFGGKVQGLLSHVQLDFWNLFSGEDDGPAKSAPTFIPQTMAKASGYVVMRR